MTRIVPVRSPGWYSARYFLEVFAGGSWLSVGNYTSEDEALRMRWRVRVVGDSWLIE
jgi:hypothetical protein